MSVGKNKKLEQEVGNHPEQVPEYRSQVMIALQLMQVSAAPGSTYEISTLGKKVSAYFTHLFHDTHDLGHLSGFERTSNPYNCRKRDSCAFKFCLLLLSSKGKHAVLLFAFLNPSSFSKS